MAKAKGIFPKNFMLAWGAEAAADDKKTQYLSTYFLRGEHGQAVGGLSGDVIKYAVAENNSGRFTNWINKQYKPNKA